MSVSAISSPHVAPQPTTAPPPARTQAADPTANNNATGTTWNWAKDSRPAQSSSSAPGTGLTVDRNA